MINWSAIVGIVCVICFTILMIVAMRTPQRKNDIKSKTNSSFNITPLWSMTYSYNPRKDKKNDN